MIFLFIVLFLIPSWVNAAVTVDTTGSAEGDGVDTASASYAHTIASDANAVLICLSQRDTNTSGYTADTASVTVGGQAASQLIGVTDTLPSTRAVLFYKLAPLTGSQTIASTSDTGADRLVMTAISLKGVVQSSTFNTADSAAASASGTDADVDGIASAVGEFAVMCGASSTAASTASPDATAPTSTEQIDIAHTNGTSVRGWIYTEDGASTSIDMRVDLASSVRWSAVAVSIRPDTSSFGILRRRSQ